MDDVAWYLGGACLVVLLLGVSLWILWTWAYLDGYQDGMVEAVRRAEADFLAVVAEEGIRPPTLPRPPKNVLLPPPSDCGNWHERRPG